MSPYQLITEKKYLQGTCYYELLPGKYHKGRIWTDDSIFLSEETHYILEPCLAAGFPNYNGYSFQDIDAFSWQKILTAFDQVPGFIEERHQEHLSNSDKFVHKLTEKEFFANCPSNARILNQTLQDLRHWITTTLQSQSHIALLGL